MVARAGARHGRQGRARESVQKFRQCERGAQPEPSRRRFGGLVAAETSARQTRLGQVSAHLAGETRAGVASMDMIGLYALATMVGAAFRPRSVLSSVQHGADRLRALMRRGRPTA